MVDTIIHNQILQIIVFQAAILLVVLTNSYFLYRSRRHATPLIFPNVSILVPARNEEKNIGRCVHSLLKQDYPSFEVIVLDDQSSDGTRPILEEIAAAQPNLNVLAGNAPPGGWSGKNWACHQLSEAAGGDLFFFTDADTAHHPNSLRSAVTALLGEQADMLTGFPRQELGSWGEKLLVPFFSWASLCFIPLALAYRFRLPALSVAVGQMILFRRQAYQAVGGHQSVRSSIVEDLMLARRMKAAGLRWRMAHISDLVTCRMYCGSRAAYDGFVKNFSAVFNYRLLPYAFVFTWLAVMFWKPLLLLIQAIGDQTGSARFLELAACVVLGGFLWLLPYLELGLPSGLAFIYPLTTLAVEIVAFQSLRLSMTGGISWKDRKIIPPKWKWL